MPRFDQGSSGGGGGGDTTDTTAPPDTDTSVSDTVDGGDAPTPVNPTPAPAPPPDPAPAPRSTTGGSGGAPEPQPAPRDPDPVPAAEPAPAPAPPSDTGGASAGATGPTPEPVPVDRVDGGSGGATPGGGPGRTVVSDDQIEATANEATNGSLGDPIDETPRASQSRSFGTTGTPGLASEGVVEPREEEIREQTPRANQSRSFGTTGTPSASRGAVEPREQEIRERTPRASQSRSFGTTGTPSLANSPTSRGDGVERFGDSTGFGADVERVVDDTSGQVAGIFRDQAEQFEQRADEAAENQPVNPPGTTLAGPGLTELGGELGEGLFNTAAGIAETPQTAIEGAETALYLAEGTRITGAEEGEFERRVGLLGEAGVAAAGAAAESARENPEDFAAEFVAGAALSGGTSLLARGSRLGSVFGRAPDTTRRGAAADAFGDVGGEVGDAARAGGGRVRDGLGLLGREFRSGGRDRAQLGGSGFGGDNVRTLDDIVDDDGPSGGDVEVTDGDQKMLMREETLQRDRTVDRTPEEQAAIDDMQQGDLLEDLRREEAAAPTAEERAAIEEMQQGDLAEQARTAADGTTAQRTAAAGAAGGLFGGAEATAVADTETEAAVGGAFGAFGGEQQAASGFADTFGGFGAVSDAGQEAQGLGAFGGLDVGATAGIGAIAGTAFGANTTARGDTGLGIGTTTTGDTDTTTRTDTRTTTPRPFDTDARMRDRRRDLEEPPEGGGGPFSFGDPPGESPRFVNPIASGAGLFGGDADGGAFGPFG